jgi:hypothetical protein
MDTNTVESNAYWECSNIGIFDQNVWYLVVGHIYPWSTTYTGRNPDTGIYTVNGRWGNIPGCNIGTGDIKWNPNATTGLHRVYHYYCPDNTSRLQFFQPRVDLVDGSEPSIAELLNDAGSKFFDISGNSRNFTWNTSPVWTNAGSMSYISTLNNISYGPASNSFNINNGTGYTIFMISTTQTDNSNSAFKFAGSDVDGRGIFLHPGWSNYTMYFDQGGCCDSNQRLSYTFTQADMRNFRVWTFRSRLYDRTIFMNGQPYATSSTYAANINLTSGVVNLGNIDESLDWNGQLAYFSVYNTGLDDTSVNLISNSLRGRFGI